ncbi:MAG: hypothetical protein JWQ03_616 [Variovorax sp.]|nr:hypothetical protein [Variovorax sp.]
MKTLLTVKAQAVQHTLQQGSRAWHQHRFGCNNASDAAAMMGDDPHRSRNDLLHSMYVGFSPDVSSFKQGIYDKGHLFEEHGRTLAEALMGEDLYPLVLSRDWSQHGIRRPISASLDGSTIARKRNWEHKQLNAELAAALPYPGEAGAHLNNAADLPARYLEQMEQQFMANGEAEECLFTASAWNPDGTLKDARHCWYKPDPELRARLVAGWIQWEHDYAAYTPVEVIEKPAAVGRRPDQLPAIFAQATGQLVLESNIKEWEEAALAFIKSVREHKLETDQDFEDADAAAKWCETSKLALQGVRAQLMSATGDVNTAVGTLERIEQELDKTRIAFTNAIKARKETRKTELIELAKGKAVEWVRGIEQKLVAMLDQPPAQPLMPELSHARIEANWGKCVFNKKSFKNMQDALDQELARVKIASSALGDLFAANINVIKVDAKEHKALFADWRTLIWKDTEDLRNTVRLRVADHKAEQERILREAEEKRQREEAARLQREQDARDAEAQAAQRHQQEVAHAVQHLASLPGAQAATEAAMRDQLGTGTGMTSTTMTPQGPVVQHVPAANVQPIRQPARGPATLKLGEINARVSPIQLTAEGLIVLGFPVVSTEKGAKLYREEDFPAMVEALQRHCGKVLALALQGAAA